MIEKDETEKKIEEPVEEEQDLGEEEEEKLKLPFPNATVVREMKKHIQDNKMIRREVKIAMNKFLGNMVMDVTARMDKLPYAMIDYRMFEDAIKPYKQVAELDAERKRIEAHLDAIIQDCLSIKRDFENKFGAKEEFKS